MQNIISPPNLRGLGLALDIVKFFSSPVHPSIHPSIRQEDEEENVVTVAAIVTR
jgi:hypothetical protein